MNLDDAADDFDCVPLSARMSGIACAKRWERQNGPPQNRRGLPPLIGCQGCAEGEARATVIKVEDPEAMKVQRRTKPRKATHVVKVRDVEQQLDDVEEHVDDVNESAYRVLAEEARRMFDAAEAELKESRRISENRRKMLNEARKSRDDWREKAGARRVELRNAHRRLEAAEARLAGLDVAEAPLTPHAELELQNGRLLRELARVKEALDTSARTLARASTIVDSLTDPRRGDDDG